MRTIFIGIARMGSTRLPGKVLKDLGGVSVLRHIVDAGVLTPGVDEIWIATSTLAQDDVIEEWCADNGVRCFRGSETDVLSRFAGAARAAKADVAVRVTCDCPFLDPKVIGEVIALREATGAEYASNNDPPCWPDGLDCEAITMEALEAADQQATRPSDRDTVTQYIVRNRYRFPAVSLPCPIPGLHKERWVLDTEADYEFCKKVMDGVGNSSYLHILAYLNKHPELREINSHHPRNERFFESLASEEPVKRWHGVSHFLLQDAQKIIPLGAQTFSKSYLQYPEEAPLFVTHGNGGLTYDVDGNDYVDLVGGLLPNMLGHRDVDVDFAIRQQLNAGISFSMATDLEQQLAVRLQGLIPCAEMSRFAKNGTDVTTAAIRLSRHITGRPNILSSGYHGWADWSICHDKLRNQGVLSEVQNHTTILEYGDIDRARRTLNTKSFACVIVEPETDPAYLNLLRTLCDETDTLLIFDEVITGFRFGLGGAQKLYNVTPDLATFGKSMANGMPISAICGKAKYMEKIEEICFSGTFFGETLSLAAALATIDKLEREDVPRKLLLKNIQIMQKIQILSFKYGVDDFITAGGDRLLRLSFKDQDIKTLFIQEMIANGVIIIASFNWCFAHEVHHINRVVAALDRTFATIKDAITRGEVHARIKGKAIEVQHPWVWLTKLREFEVTTTRYGWISCARRSNIRL